MKSQLSRYMLLASMTLMSMPSPGNLITFDDIDLGTLTNGVPHLTGDITNGYQNLNWVNFLAENAVLTAQRFGPNGYSYGMLTISNVAFNSDGASSEIDSLGTNFNFLSTYLTGAFRSNLNIQVQGFRGGNLVYDQIVFASATNPTLFVFNYQNIDRLSFDSFGGDNAGFISDGSQFAMDNFSFEFVPEPSALLLTATGALILWPLLKRRRATLKGKG